MARDNESALSRFSGHRRWRRKLALAVAILVGLAGAAYATHCTLLLNVARVVLGRDPDLIAQERRDGVIISFRSAPAVWVKPIKNLMNPIWLPIHAGGVNYFTFAAPSSVFRSFSERSNPRSPYYQAWVGGYVTKRNDGTLPSDLPNWASQVTALDQRSWLSSMGDPAPLADFGEATPAGTIEIDGHVLPLWHGVMRSHSDLSDHPQEPLAVLLGMPSKSMWPLDIHAFHDVTLDGYFACWSDANRGISIVIYTVAAVFETPSGGITDNRKIKDQLLNLMKSARIEPLS